MDVKHLNPTFDTVNTSVQFVQECLSSKENAPPVLMGGAVEGLLTNRSRNVAGVSLFAAHMPGTSQKNLVPPDLPVPHTSMILKLCNSC